MKTRDLSNDDFVRITGNLADVLDAAETEVSEYNPAVTDPWQLQYTDQDSNTVTFLSDQAAKDLLLRRASWKYGAVFKETDTVDIGDLGEAFYREYRAWWSRRGEAFGWLDEMMKRRDYDPLENYDRKEDGGWSDTTDIGARSGTYNLSDVYAAYTDTETETPTVKTKETVTPTVKTKQTETPGVTDTVTVTPRAEHTRTETPGVSTTVAESVYGDNSSNETPYKKTVTSPGGGQSNVVKDAGTAGTDTTVTGHVGTNETVNEVVSGDTQTVNEVVSGNTQTTMQHAAHTDQHNTSTSSLAAKDVVTRLFDEYRVHGNIGVRAVSDMLLAEYNLRSAIDLRKMAIEEITNQLCYLAE